MGGGVAPSPLLAPPLWKTQSFTCPHLFTIRLSSFFLHFHIIYITYLIRHTLDNIYVTYKQYTMNKLKLINNKQLLKLNNKLYIPFLIHNLPNNYNKFDVSNIIKIGTTIYINSIEFTKKQVQQYINTINYSNINSNNIK